MAEPALRRSPLETSVAAFRQVSGPALTLEAVPFETHLSLRGDENDVRFVTAVESATRIPLPSQVGAVTGSSTRAICLAPDEWLLVAPDEARQALITSLADTLIGCHHALVDVSVSRAVIGLRGPRARDVLAKGLALDLHPSAFTAPRCAQTVFAKIGVLLEQTDEAPSYRLYVRASFAAYVAAWLIDAAPEFASLTPARS